MAATKNIDIDFQVLKTGDPKKLIVCDTSVWGIVEDKPAIIEIFTPTEKLVKHYIAKNKNNVYNSSNLYLGSIYSKQDLPDGIYRITIKASPDTFYKTRNYIKTDKLQLEVDKLYLSMDLLGLDKDKALRKTLEDINFMICASEAATRRNETKRAISYYKEAQRIFDEHNRCKK